MFLAFTLAIVLAACDGDNGSDSGDEGADNTENSEETESSDPGEKRKMENLQVLKLEKKFFKIIVPAVMVKICQEQPVKFNRSWQQLF